MQNLGDLFCPICLDYFVKPVTASCGHSFCELCIQQYFLHFDICTLCEAPIRKQKVYRANALANFVENFIRAEHQVYLPDYQRKIEKTAQFKEDKPLEQLATGELVDIRDSEYIWRVGRIVRIISRVGETHKYIKVLLLDCPEKVEEQLKVTSERLAKPGFYTSRADIPKYSAKTNKDNKC